VNTVGFGITWSNNPNASLSGIAFARIVSGTSVSNTLWDSLAKSRITFDGFLNSSEWALFDNRTRSAGANRVNRCSTFGWGKFTNSVGICNASWRCHKFLSSWASKGSVTYCAGRTWVFRLALKSFDVATASSDTTTLSRSNQTFSVGASCGDCVCANEGCGDTFVQAWVANFFGLANGFVQARPLPGRVIIAGEINENGSSSSAGVRNHSSSTSTGVGFLEASNTVVDAGVFPVASRSSCG